MPQDTVTRFAPSPTGHLHLGHAYAALFAARAARDAGGRFLLRIEDIDTGRCRASYEDDIYEDLRWLGLDWKDPVLRQSDRRAAYRDALRHLDQAGLLYPCFCTRRDIAAEIAASASAPQGPDGPLYPGTCRALSREERTARIAAGEDHALRLDSARAVERAGALAFIEHGETGDRAAIPADPLQFGDVVLGRKDIGTSYHIAVVTDDAFQGVTLVTRGADLKPATHLHRLLQALLDLPVPEYHHHALVTDEDGKRLAKRHDAGTIRGFREQGLTPAQVRAMAGLPDGQ